MSDIPTEDIPNETPAEEPGSGYVDQATETPSGEAAARPVALPPSPLSASDARTWAFISHLSVLLNLVTAIFGPLIPLIVYLIFKDRSRYVAYQSMQAFLFQLIWWVGGGVLVGVAWAITGILMPVLIGFCLVPIACLVSLLPVGTVIYGVVGAIQTSQGQDFRYWLIGDWVRNLYKG